VILSCVTELFLVLSFHFILNHSVLGYVVRLVLSDKNENLLELVLKLLPGFFYQFLLLIVFPSDVRVRKSLGLSHFVLLFNLASLKIVDKSFVQIDLVRKLNARFIKCVEHKLNLLFQFLQSRWVILLRT